MAAYFYSGRGFLPPLNSLAGQTAAAGIVSGVLCVAKHNQPNSLRSLSRGVLNAVLAELPAPPYAARAVSVAVDSLAGSSSLRTSLCLRTKASLKIPSWAWKHEKLAVGIGVLFLVKRGPI